MREKRYFIRIGLLVTVLTLSMVSFAFSGEVLMMATTTSTDNTGLLDYLSPHFTKSTGIELKWTAVGTGKALKLGENCDVDVLLVHAPGAEKKYVANGFGTDRREVMYNDFIIIGPESDPAVIKGQNITDALKKVRAEKGIFVSRGDNSGTNKKEIGLWEATKLALPDKEAWYIQTGQGMLATINVAAERGGYTLTDRGTYIKYEDNYGGKPPLKILVEGDAMLRNQYSVMTVSPDRCPKCRRDLAGKFADWITSPKAQKLIKEFKLLGKQLFNPQNTLCVPNAE